MRAEDVRDLAYHSLDDDLYVPDRIVDAMDLAKAIKASKQLEMSDLADLVVDAASANEYQMSEDDLIDVTAAVAVLRRFVGAHRVPPSFGMTLVLKEEI